MAITDTVADMLTRVRNANKERKRSADVVYSKLNGELARLMQAEGFIEKVEFLKNKAGFDFIRVHLRYTDAKIRVVQGLKRVSKPGCRVYVGSGEIPRVLNGYGVAVLSTHRGLLTDRAARTLNVGGEHVCNIW